MPLALFMSNSERVIVAMVIAIKDETLIIISDIWIVGLGDIRK